MSDSWQAISPLLEEQRLLRLRPQLRRLRGSGAIGVYGVGDIPTSAGELEPSSTRCSRRPARAKVDLVGHSQGGMMPRYYLKFLGGAAEGPHPGRALAVQPRHHPRRALHARRLLPRASPFTGALCPACDQQIAGSAFLTELNAGGETVAGVDYTVIETRFDEVVTPYTSAFLTGPSVKNILLQNQCILDLGDHLSMPYDHIAAADVLTALDPLHPRGFLCTPIAPTAGG